MSKFKNGLVKRVLAVILSGAMVMSNMTLYAAEVSRDAQTEQVETAVSEVSEPEAEETESKETEKPNDEDAVQEETTTTASDESKPAETEKQTESENQTETVTEQETQTTEESKVEETVSDETETTEVETTEVETTEEETTEESVDNAEADVVNFEIKEDLKTGVEYGDSTFKFSVLENMKSGSKKITVNGKDYTSYVVGDNNPSSGGSGVKDQDGKRVPDAGAAFKLMPARDVKVTFIVNGASGSEASKAKHWFFIEGSTGKSVKNSDLDALGFDAGAYDCDLTAGETYYFYANGTKVNVYGISWEVTADTPVAWADVPNPTIKVGLSKDDKTRVQVTVDTPIGPSGADKITAYMYDEKGAELDKAESTEKNVLEFSPEESGKYSFKAEISREGEAEVKTSESKTFDFTLQDREWKFLAFGNGVSAGKDTHEVHDDGSVTIVATSGKIVPASNDGLAFYYTELNPNNTNFTLSANAHVNSWKFSNGQEGFGIMAADTIGTSTRVWNNSYQAVVSRVSYRWDGEGISEDGSGESIQMQIGVGSTEKTGVTPADVEAINNNEAAQPAQLKAEQTAIDTTFAKYGAGQYNMVANFENEDPPIGSTHELYEDFYLQIQKNNTGYFVSYTKYVMNEDGTCKLDENGNKILDTSTTTTKKYYDPEALNVLDQNKVYVGVFASRNANITFSDIKLKTIASDKDEPREERTPQYVNLSKSVVSGSLTSTPDYDFAFSSNWNGKLVLKDNSGQILSKHTEKITDKDGNEAEIELDYYDVRGSLDPAVQYLPDGDDNKSTKVIIPISDLKIGKNVFTVEYTPDEDWTPEEDPYSHQKLVLLRSYDTVKVTHTVEYRKYGDEYSTIYVSQDGKSTNLGTKDSPLNIYTAVQYAQPGQTILLAGGRYNLNRTLQVPKGVNGEPDKRNEAGEPDEKNGKETYNRYIKMIGDPEADERPVLDFNGLVAAMVAVGDYWYFKDFDVIRCKDGEKGIQVSGSYCVYDRVDTYRNGSTGLQICRASGTDTYKDWPHDNLILNCNSYLNVDKGYEDADGFAAKLTSGSNNVFDGCIAAFNADDGWDLFAKAQTGSIGGVVIKNSIAYRNGYVLKSVKDGSIKTPDEAAATGDSVICVKGDGNGNGFKMGGDGLPAGSEYDPGYGEDPNAAIPNIGHRLYNSLAFGNKSKGFDSNSAPNVKAYNSISFNNDASNISFTTYDTNKNTDYELQNVVSFRTGTDPSKTEADAKTFSDGYKTTYSLNFNGDMDASNRSAAVYFSLKNARSMAAKVKIWWRSSDSEANPELMIASEKGELLGSENRISSENGLIISELETKNKEKCYLGSKGGSINLYKAEITTTVDGVERTDVVDISSIYTKAENLADNYRVYSKPVEIRLYFRTVPEDKVGEMGKQDPNKVSNETVYKWDASKNASVNKSGKQIKASDFVSLDYPYLNTVSPENWRNADGTVKMDGFLQLKPGAGSYPADQTPALGGTESKTPEDLIIGEETDGSIMGGNPSDDSSSDYGEDYPEGGLKDSDNVTRPEYFEKMWAAPVKYLDYTTKAPIYYTGKEIRPEIHIRYSTESAMLVEKKDYKVTYKNNVKAGTATAIITGIGNFAGRDLEVQFTINPIDISKVNGDGSSVSIADVAVTSGNPEKALKPIWNGRTLRKDTDYRILEYSPEKSTLTVEGIGNFTGKKTINAHVISSSQLMSKANVKLLDKNIAYDGTEQKPRCEVRLGGQLLTMGKDYSVEYTSNIKVGKATLTVVGDGVNYFGNKSVNFDIKPRNIKTVRIDKGKYLTDYEINGKTFDGNTFFLPENSIKVYATVMDEDGNAKEVRLKNGVDYKIAQRNGSSKVIVAVQGINNYTGSQAFSYKTKSLNIKDPSVKVVCATSMPYGEIQFVPGENFDIYINDIAVDSKNYILEYARNTTVKRATDANPPKLIVRGRRGLSGSREFKFDILPVSLTGNANISVSARDIATNGKELKCSDLKRSRIEVKHVINGRVKTLNTKYEYDKNTIEYYIDMNGNNRIDDKDTRINTDLNDPIAKFSEQGYVTVLVRVHAATKSPMCYEGYVDGSFRAAMYDIKQARVANLKDRVYGKCQLNGSLVKQIDWSNTEIARIEDYMTITYRNKNSEIVTLNCQGRRDDYDYVNDAKNLLNKTGFVIVPNSYVNNTKVGTASFEIRGTGMYSGTKRVTFKIVSEKTNRNK